MNVRSLFAVAALCGVGLAGWCGTAQAGVCNIIYGYCNGMTFRAECPEGAYSHWSLKHDACNPQAAGRKGIYTGKSQNCPPSGGTYGGNVGGKGHGPDYGDYYAPTPAGGMKGMPGGTKPNLQPTPASPVPGDREATPRKSPNRTVGHMQGTN